MPGPPPPPPPAMGPPPPPMTLKMPFGGGGADDRGALLKSIQKGTKLKKAVTNDKSAPLIGGKTSGGNNNASSGGTLGRNGRNFNGASSSPASPMNGGGLNLGEIFANGRPKLKSTGNSISNSTSNINNNTQNGRKLPSSKQGAQNNGVKRQFADNKLNRGPPPPAPTRNLEEHAIRPPQFQMNSRANGDVQNQPLPATPQMQKSTLHRKVPSNTSIHSYDATDTSIHSYNQNSYSPKAVISHGKPNLAPKPPPVKPTAPPKKLHLNGKPVGRAHSMKSPRSPSPQPSDAVKFGTVRNMASLLAPALNISTSNLSSPRPRPALNTRPSIPPPDIPSQIGGGFLHGALPPPPSKTSVKPPNHAPPPPPTHTPPPPPPHRSAPTRAPPAVPQAGAPPPPPRHSSMTPNRRIDSDFEERFRKLFHEPATFPKPPPYKKVFKNYGNRGSNV